MTTTSPAFVNYYEILGLSLTANVEAIKEKLKEEQRTWRKRQASPDLTKRQEAELRMQHLAAAKDVLLDVGKRAGFDQRLAGHREVAPRPTVQTGGRDWLTLAEEYLAQNDYSSASYAAREATQTEGNSARAWNLRARANAGLHQLNDAVYEGRQAAELEPNNPQFQFDLGGVYEQLERWGDALSSYEAAARLDPRTFLYRLSIAGVYLQNDSPKQAMPILEQVTREHPNDQMVNFYLASALHDLAEQVPAHRGSGSYMITSPKEIEEMEQLLHRAMLIQHGDRELQVELQRVITYVVECKRVKFKVPPAFFNNGPTGLFLVPLAFLVPVFLVFGSFGVMATSPGGGIFMLLIGGLIGFGVFKWFWAPGWKQNKRVQ